MVYLLEVDVMLKVNRETRFGFAWGEGEAPLKPEFTNLSWVGVHAVILGINSDKTVQTSLFVNGRRVKGSNVAWDVLYDLETSGTTWVEFE